MKYAANYPVTAAAATSSVGIVDPAGGAVAGLIGPAGHRELAATDETLVAEIKGLRGQVAAMNEILTDKLSE